MSKFESTPLSIPPEEENLSGSKKLGKRIRTGVAIAAATGAAVFGIKQVEKAHEGQEGDSEGTSERTEAKEALGFENEAVRGLYEASLRAYHEEIEEPNIRRDRNFEESYKDRLARAIEIASQKGFPIYLESEPFRIASEQGEIFTFKTSGGTLVSFRDPEGVPVDIAVRYRDDGERTVPFSPDDYSPAELKKLQMKRY